MVYPLVGRLGGLAIATLSLTLQGRSSIKASAVRDRSEPANTPTSRASVGFAWTEAVGSREAAEAGTGRNW